MSGKKSIFVSSVQKELAAERRALKDYIHGDPLLRRFFEVFLFEDLPATDRRADDIEQAGTGTLDMIARSREAGLKAPEFRQDGGQFVQTLWRPISASTGQATPQVTPQVNLAQDKHLEELALALGVPTPQVTPQVTGQVAKLLRAAETPQSREELQAQVGLLTANTSAKPCSITC